MLPFKLYASFVLKQKYETIIYDVRNCKGGVPTTIAFLSSNLYGQKKILLNTYESRVTGKYELFTLPKEAVYDGTNKIHYILASSGRASGGEAFAYFNQQHGRAKVIGETTAGAGRLSVPHPISERLSVLIPENNSYHPVSQTGFEKTGVQPDMAIDPEAALFAAHKMALETQIAKGDTSAKGILEKLEQVKADEKAALAKLEAQYQAYLGNYEGERKVWISQDGELKYRRERAATTILSIKTNDLYALKVDLPPGARLTGGIPKIQFHSNGSGVVESMSLIYKDRTEGPFLKLN